MLAAVFWTCSPAETPGPTLFRVEICITSDPLIWRINCNKAAHSQFVFVCLRSDPCLKYLFIFATLSVVSAFWLHLLQQPSPRLSGWKNNCEGRRAHLSTASLWVSSHTPVHFSELITLHSQWVASMKSLLLSFPALEVTACSVESICEESWVTGVWLAACRPLCLSSLHQWGNLFIWPHMFRLYDSAAEMCCNLRSSTSALWNSLPYLNTRRRFRHDAPDREEENKGTSSVLFGSGSQHLHKTERTVALSGKGCLRRTFERSPEDNGASQRIAEPFPLVFVVVGKRPRWFATLFTRRKSAEAVSGRILN